MFFAKNMKLKDYIFILTVAGMAVSLYFAKVALPTIALLILVIAVFRLFKGRIYAKIEERIRNRSFFASKCPAWMVKLIVVVSFIILFVLLKWIVFEVFKIFGMDLRQNLTDAINR